MALNCAMLNATREPIPLPGESIISTIESGAEVNLLIPDVPPEEGSLAGGSGGSQKLKAIGRIWITDRRVRTTASTTYRCQALMLVISFYSLLPQIRRSTR